MARRSVKAARIVGAVFAVLSLLMIIVVIGFTATDWGRERIRAFGVGQLASQVNGRVTIARLDGLLFSGATLEDVVIEDTAGAPFLRADSVHLRYSLRSLLSKHLVFSDVHLVRPVIVLDQTADGRWNYARIFPRDTAGPATMDPAADTARGFGSWIRFEDVVITDGTVIVRRAWQPVAREGEARSREVARALSPQTRSWVVETPAGLRSIMMMHQLDAELPLVRIADPDSARRVIEVASASMIAFPFRPPAATVTGLSGRIVIGDDTIFASDLNVAFPSTSLEADGIYMTESGALTATLDAPGIAFEDLHWIMPELPEGGGSINADVALEDGSTALIVHDMDLALDGGDVAGSFDVRFGDTLRVAESDVTFDEIDTRLIERLSGTALPLDGVATGAVRLTGTPDDLSVDGRAEFRERNGASSRLLADGEIGTAPDGGIRARALRLRFDPLRTSLVRQVSPAMNLAGTITGNAIVTGTTRSRFDVAADLIHHDPRAGDSRVIANGGVQVGSRIAARDLELRFAPLRVPVIASFSPDFPLDGTVTGTALLNGSPDTRLSARLDVTHEGEGGASRVQGTGAFASGGAAPAIELDLCLPVLSLETVGRFAPAAGLHGSAGGTLRASGTTQNFGFLLDLATTNGGAITAEGDLDRRSADLRYDVRSALRGFDAGAISERAPETDLTGTIAIDGRGTDPATLQASLQADLVDTAVDSIALDTTRVRATFADGIATIAQGHISLGSASADVEGTLGLVAGRSGELNYRIDVESLDRFGRYFPADTSPMVARPLTQARLLAAARADSLRIARATEVERAATGYPPPPELDVDSIPPIPGDSVSGQVRAEGVLTGSIRRFNVRGTAEASQVVAAGATFSSGRADYTLNDFGSPDADLTLEAGVDSLRISGFSFDSASADVNYRGQRNRGRGSSELAVFQDPDRDYRLAADFLLELDRREITFNELVMRFDTVQWSSPHPGRISWAGDGVMVDSVELGSDVGEGLLRLDGRIPTDGELDLRVQIEQLPIGQIAAVLQDTILATGQLNFETQLAGTRAAPTFEGTTSFLSGTFRERPVPDVHARFSYANTELRTTAELRGENRSLLEAQGTLPLNLALASVEGSRMLPRPIHIDARADSLPLEALPSFTDAVEDVRGRLRGGIVVAGTYEEPELEGGIDLDLASMRIVAPGIALREIAGRADLSRNAVTIDSLVGYSGGGLIRISGALEIESLARPIFDLELQADGAIVLDNDRGRLRTDANLRIAGPLDSARITGDAEVNEGVIQVPDFGAKKRVTPLDDASVRMALDTAEIQPGVLPERSLLDQLQLDIGLRVGRNTWVRNSDGNVEIYSPDDADPLRIRSNIDAPGFQLEGVINADRGEYAFAGRVFELTTGSVTFIPSGEFDPLLLLTANYEVPRRGRENLVIQIHLTGSLSQPRVALESTAEPPLPQSDILSYLAFGRSSSSVLSLDDAGLSGGQDGGGIGTLAQQQLATLAIGATVDDLVSDLERKGGSAGFDVFRIHPADLPEELAFEGDWGTFLRGTEIVAGKYVRPRLFVAAEGRTSGETWPGLRVEYETGRGFSWVTTWEPRFLPSEPSLEVMTEARQARVFGTFFFWSRRF